MSREQIILYLHVTSICKCNILLFFQVHRCTTEIVSLWGNLLISCTVHTVLNSLWCPSQLQVTYAHMLYVFAQDPPWSTVEVGLKTTSALLVPPLRWLVSHMWVHAVCLERFDLLSWVKASCQSHVHPCSLERYDSLLLDGSSFPGMIWQLLTLWSSIRQQLANQSARSYCSYCLIPWQPTLQRNKHWLNIENI